MQRLLVIISNNFDNEIAGKWVSFFSSNYAGAWDSKEMLLLNNPGKYELERLKETGKNYDYIISIILSKGVKDSGKTLFKFKDSLLTEDVFIIPVKRQLIIIDSCRLDLKDSYCFDLPQIKTKFGEITKNRTRYKEAYNDIINLSPAGYEIIYGCCNMNCHNEALKTGLLSNSLIETALNEVIKLRDDSDIIEIERLVDESKLTIKRSHHFQSPSVTMTGKNKSFPFIIKL